MGLFKSKPKTHFEATSTFKDALVWIKLLKNKEIELKAADEVNGANTPDHRKYKALYNLNFHLNEAIEAFNKQKPKDNKEAEQQEIVNLAKKLYVIVDNYGMKLEQTFKLKRFNETKLATNVLNGATVAGSLAAMTMAPPTFGLMAKGTTAFIVAPILNKQIKEMIIKLLAKKEAKSYVCVKALSKVMTEIIENLELEESLLLTNKPSHPVVPPEYRDSISGEIMKTPVICKVDGVTYEEDSIRDYLINKRETPTGYKISEEQEVDSLLILNRPLKNLIDKARIDNPKLFDEDLQQSIKMTP